jgi:integration host factor subunit alpha
MTKADLIENVYNRIGGFSKKESAEVVETVFKIMKDTLRKNENIKISGFGKFTVRDKKERLGRNPKTGVPIKITERRVVTFRPSAKLKEILNKR